MGYTHYWYTSLTGIPKSNWNLLCEDVKKLLANIPSRSPEEGGYSDDPLQIAWEDDQPEKPPEISDDVIRFNGTGDGDLGHETFLFERVGEQPDYRANEPELFAFCKTAHKPYDLVVCGVLIVVQKHAGECVRIDSDGVKKDWMPAVHWVQSVLGDGYGLPPCLWPIDVGAIPQ